MIPEDELAHCRAARAEVEEADVQHGEHMLPQPDPEQVAFEKELIHEARTLKRECPLLFDAMRDRTYPRADDRFMLMRPDTAKMSFGQLMAFRLGQDSVTQWIEVLASTKEHSHE